MKIALIDPPGISTGLNSGLAYIAANILDKRHGDSVRVFDFNNNRKHTNERIKEAGGYEVIGLSVKSFTQREAFSILDSIDLKPETIVIFGGPHISMEKEEFFKKHARANAILMGEAETSFCNLLDWSEGKRNESDVRGAALRRENSSIFTSGNMGLEEDLDSLPFPCYSVFDSILDKIDNYPLLTSRGCPYKCIYCSVGSISGKKWRSRKIDSIMKEIKTSRDRFGFGYFFIIDDNFTLDKERAKGFCNALIAEKTGLHWTLPNGIRADKLDEGLVKLMKLSGCEAVSFGIESADPGVFKNIGKGETLEDIESAIKFCRKYGLRVSGKFIIGLPGSNHDSTVVSIQWAKKMGFYDINWNLLVPYPGTEAYEYVRKNSRFIRPWEEGFHFGPSPRVTFETDSYSAREMERDARWTNVSSKNLLCFYDSNHNLFWNIIRMLSLIVRYDPLHAVSQLRYIFMRWKLRRRRVEFV